MRRTQEDLKKYVANGGDLWNLSEKQIVAIPQEVINQRVANGGDLFYLSKKQIVAIPQEVVNQYVAKGGSLFYLSKKQRAGISKKAWNQYVANGGSLFYLSKEQRADIPQEAIIKRAIDGWCLEGLTEEQKKAIPEQILEISENAREALILYDAGKIKSSELPSDVFVNYKARQCLLGIIKKKTTMRFAELCKKSGYYKSGVPEEVQMAFDEKLEQIGQEVDERMRSGVKELTGQSEEKQAKIKKEIGEWGW